MAESAPGSRGPDRSGPEAGGSSPGKAAIPGAAPLRSPRDTQGEGSDGNSETPTSSLTPSEEDVGEEEGHQWRVGDACTTTWAGDGLLYPARLRALDPVAGTCLVEFDGYGNTEERALAELLPPRPGAWVSDTPRGEGPRAEPRRPSTPSSWEPPGVRRKKGEWAPCSPQYPKVTPPLWSPASLHTTQEEEEEEDTLASMLMAWYMSGYHTGFYVGLREGRAEAAEPLPRPGHRQKKPPRS
ncbi:LOW QUALITY PROTEIN: survival motor neuron protein 1-like [Morus bassanus]